MPSRRAAAPRRTAGRAPSRGTRRIAPRECTARRQHHQRLRAESRSAPKGQTAWRRDERVDARGDPPEPGTGRCRRRSESAARSSRRAWLSGQPKRRRTRGQAARARSQRGQALPTSSGALSDISLTAVSDRRARGRHSRSGPNQIPNCRAAKRTLGSSPYHPNALRAKRPPDSHGLALAWTGLSLESSGWSGPPRSTRKTHEQAPALRVCLTKPILALAHKLLLHPPDAAVLHGAPDVAARPCLVAVLLPAAAPPRIVAGDARVAWRRAAPWPRCRRRRRG